MTIEPILEFLGPGDVRTCLDLGSRDGEQAHELSRAFPRAVTYAFEANPDLYDRCRRRLAGNDRTRFVPLAVGGHDGVVPLFRARGNVGATSVFPKSGLYDPWEVLDQMEPISVPCTRIDTWAAKNGVSTVDVVWADLQGYELQAFVGMGDLLRTVRLAHCEVEYRPIYQGQPLFPEVYQVLFDAGLRLARAWAYRPHYFWGDAIFVRP